MTEIASRKEPNVGLHIGESTSVGELHSYGWPYVVCRVNCAMVGGGGSRFARRSLCRCAPVSSFFDTVVGRSLSIEGATEGGRIATVGKRFT
jgi:hypothetical protein